MNVLIVDDDRVSRMLLGHIVAREFGAAVTEALNGADALELLKRQPFDFLLLDLMMPVMDGLQTLEAIRTPGALQRMPVIILSAVKEEAKVRRILQLGVSDYLAKPLHPKSILQRLRRIVPELVRRRELEAAAGGPTAPIADPAGAPAKVEVVVADADPTYRSFVRSVLGREYRIIEAENGAKALRRCVEARPQLLLIGEGLGAVDRALVVRKLRAVPDLRATRIVGIVPASRVEPTAADALCDATMPRTLSATVFRDQFLRLARPIEPAAGPGEMVAGVRLELVSTVEQVFGMMLGTEIEPLPAHPQIPGMWVSAQVDLTLTHEDFTLGVVCACPAEAGVRIAALMQSLSSDWVGDDLAAAALGDIATIIAERLQRTLAEQGRRVQSSVAEVKRGPARVADPELLRLSFNSANGDLPFQVAVRGDRKSDTTGGVLTHGARTM